MGCPWPSDAKCFAEHHHMKHDIVICLVCSSSQKGNGVSNFCQYWACMPQVLPKRCLIARWSQKKKQKLQTKCTSPSTDAKLYPKLDQSDGKTTPKWLHLDPKWHQTYPNPIPSQPHSETSPTKRFPNVGLVKCEPVLHDLEILFANRFNHSSRPLD